MKQKIKKVLALIVVLVIISCPLLLLADVGSFESYDSGSDWDYDYDDYDYDDYDYDDYDYNYDDYELSDGDANIITLIVILIIIIIIIKSNKNNPTYRTNTINDSIIFSSEYIEKKVKEVDELFNSEEFIAWTKDLFVKLQEAWMKRDWSTIRFLETNELFEQHQKQLQGYIDNHQINILERICVKNADLSDFKQVGDKDILTVVLSSKMIDYIINDETKEIIKGDKTTDRHSTYKLVFVRKTGIKTKPGMETVNTTNCPNCGAPTQITSSGKCDYCGSVITTGEFNWVLSNLEKIG